MPPFTPAQQEYIQSIAAKFEYAQKEIYDVSEKIRSIAQKNIDHFWDGKSTEGIYGMPVEQFGDEILASSTKFLADFIKQIDDDLKKFESNDNEIEIIKLLQNIRQVLVKGQERDAKFATEMKELDNRRRKLDDLPLSPRKEAKKSKKSPRKRSKKLTGTFENSSVTDHSAGDSAIQVDANPGVPPGDSAIQVDANPGVPPGDSAIQVDANPGVPPGVIVSNEVAVSSVL